MDAEYHCFFLLSLTYILYLPVIPDYAAMQWIMRAPTFGEVDVLVDRIKNCFA